MSSPFPSRSSASVSERHAEWISLIDRSGPFLAVAVLEETFPQGLDKLDTPIRQRLRAAFEEWRDAVEEGDDQLDALHQEWVRLVVQELLEYDASVLRSGPALPDGLQHHDVQSDTTFRPDFAVMSGDQPKLLISITPPGTDLENPLPGDAWLASPAERLIALCRTSRVPVGLVTNGDRWMVVNAPAEGGSSLASWYARLWFQEPVTLQAFYALVGVRRCFGEESQTLDALLKKSLEYQNEVTTTLGEQVRRAVEVLVQALDRADQDRNRTLLKDVTPAQLFEGGLTVMMRLVFLLCAEERKLLLLGEPIYDQNYAITTLRSQLVAQGSHGLEILERRQDAWSRLLATFRGVYGGISHETLRLPPFGGSLFDPDRFPFLEGRAVGTSWQDTPAVPLPIDNRTVLLLLNALQVLEHKSGAQLLSYESLDVEQIGHVYEGLLERTVKRVPEVTLGLSASSNIRKKTGYPELFLSVLEKAAQAGGENLVDHLVDTTGRSRSALQKDLASPLPAPLANRLLLACGNDLALTDRIRPFGHLLRTDSWGDPLVYPEKAFIVTHGTGRRETGSHYTPKSLTEPIVQHTLEPLVYTGPAEGLPRGEWKLKTPTVILSLKACDMAMGSGAFLVQTCRYLADRLVEAWDLAVREGKGVSIMGVVLEHAGGTELLPGDPAERVRIARRLVASRCLYGVDINPMAVEMAKLSLWLITLQRNRPFTFLDHALKCGDSLLGVTSVEQIENFSLRPGDRQVTFATANLFRYVDDAAAKRRALEDLPSNDHTQVETKIRLHAEAEAATAKVKAVADCLLAFELRGLDGDAYENQRTAAAEKVQLLMRLDADDSLNSRTTDLNPRISNLKLLAYARDQLCGRFSFHWAVEFPEVISLGGFDAIVGNPPFMGGRQMPTGLGFAYTEPLRKLYDVTGPADLVCYFFRRTISVANSKSVTGLIATNSISETVNSQAALKFVLDSGGELIRAIKSMPWPGSAAVSVALVHIAFMKWCGERWLNNELHDTITSSLDPADTGKEPFPLVQTLLYSQGTNVYGEAFIRNEGELAFLIARNLGLRPFIRKYINGDVLGEPPPLEDQLSVIDFGELDEDAISDCDEILAELKTKVAYERRNQTRQVHESRPWLHWDKRMKFYRQARKQNCIFATTIVSSYFVIHRVQTQHLYAHGIELFLSDDLATFGVLQSALHEHWVRFTSGALGKTTRYTASKCLETFPFPKLVENSPVSRAGEALFNFRESVMEQNSIGSNQLYTLFHDRGKQSADIARLRALHVEVDQAVAAAYGWSDLDLGHGFHPTKQGERYTLSEPARRTVLDRLLARNHQRYEEEVKAGLHDKKAKGKPKAKTAKTSADPTKEFALELDFESPVPPPNREPAIAPLKETPSAPGRSSADIDPAEVLNAIFNCAARREITDREALTKEVATALGFQRLRDKTRDLIASGLNSAIRRGLITYEGPNILRLAKTYSELELDTLVKAINATVRPGCLYTPEEVLKNAAEHLGCQRLREALRESLQSALTTASRRGLITKRGEEVRKVE